MTAFKNKINETGVHGARTSFKDNW